VPRLYDAYRSASKRNAPATAEKAKKQPKADASAAKAGAAKKPAKKAAAKTAAPAAGAKKKPAKKSSR
jgi:hypothetical protein